VVGISNRDGVLVEKYRYDAFGKPYIWNESKSKFVGLGTSKIGNERLFTGREYDARLKLYYYWARWYSPSLGRFLERDPIGVKDDVNLYAYVGNNPVGWSDAYGREKALVIARLRWFGNSIITDGRQSLPRENAYSLSYKQQWEAILDFADYFEWQDTNTDAYKITLEALKYWVDQSDKFSYDGTVTSDFYRTVWSWEYKCSTFVVSVLENSVSYINDSDFSWANLGYNTVTANTWANNEVDGFINVNSTEAQMWDIIAFENPDWAGHVGVFLAQNLYISARQWVWPAPLRSNSAQTFQSNDGIQIKDYISSESTTATIKRYIPHE